MVNTQPRLNKQKSKIRLRLGLGSPAQPQVKSQPQQKQHLSPIPSPNNQHQLSNSTSTRTSGISRVDSRSAFTYDFSATPSPPNHEFDTISYNTISPESPFYQNHSNIESNSTLLTCSDSEDDDDEGDKYTQRAQQAVNECGYHVNPNQIRTNAGASQGHHYHHYLQDEEEYLEGPDDTLDPAISSITPGTDDIFRIRDTQLQEGFKFLEEIGFGNWGSVWSCKPRYAHRLPNHGPGDSTYSVNERAILTMGKRSVMLGGCSKVAIKLVHRRRTPDVEQGIIAARVRALWGEMKILRSLRHEPHPNIIQFEAFVITPTYALVIMPHLPQLIQVCLAPHIAIPYFRQLASAVGYLHERGITHNDIKPANILISHNDIPVLVDFGFAQQYDMSARSPFLSSLAWGTPEYMDPIRAQGLPHDERAADVWSLGITMFELLMGRTPFEESASEEFQTADELAVYYERARRGTWVGEWSIPRDLENLLQYMIYPDPTYRISAMQAYYHAALKPQAPSVLITPEFIRAAASFDGYDRKTVPLPTAPPAVYTEAVAAVKAGDEKKKKRKTKKDGHHTHRDKDTTRHSHRATTPALGESIKQHTIVSHTYHAKDGEEDKENIDEKEQLRKLVLRKRESEIKDKEDENDDPTPTKVLKPARPLRVKDLALIADKKVVPRTSDSQLTNLSRPISASSQNTNQALLSHATSTATLKDKRVSILSSTSTIPKSKEEAVLRTMRSLEGTRKLVHGHAADKHEKAKAAEALAAIRRHAPEPPRPISLDALVELDSRKVDDRRSLGLERAVTVDIREEEVDIRVKEGGKEQLIDGTRVAREKRSSANRQPTPSPQKVRRNGRKPQAEMDTLTGKVFPASDDESPLPELRNKILVADKEQTTRYRQVSGGDRMEILASSQGESEDTIHASSTQKEIRQSIDSYASTSRSGGITRTKSVEALQMDDRLDKMSSWIKSVESIIEDARKAIAEGREPPLPILALPQELNAKEDQELQKHFGLTPDKAIPSHLRTSSIQVEPSTPSKWATTGQTVDVKEAEAKVLAANKWLEEQGKRNKKERPTVSHVLKLFGSEKERPVSGSRSNTPDVAQLVPLKPPATSSSHALKGAPSIPALRSSTTRGLTKVPQRKSESNLRNFNTMPTIPSPSFVAGPEYDPLSMSDAEEDDLSPSSPRRVMFESLIASQPGVVRQGEGWGSLSSGKGFMMAVKPSSSMASLREKARALLGDNNNNGSKGERHITDLSKPGGTQKVEKRSSRLNLHETQPPRPNTPGAASVLTLKTGEQKKGWLKSLKGAMGMGKKMDKVEEGL
uniref:CAMK/CAMKL protein kinase n=1 Tax=Kwoniella dejecticola CBS 10117 TaxID=1296121 RepID=A0A1A6A268_9TREE|nr:CAMK/CAMKL protein kinase [Kwoniella dejecticola CBS 10117]OBR84160.1 CAMK/CAMKL protein kinase [Kwoniella dejecticola CBS 10117]